MDIRTAILLLATAAWCSALELRELDLVAFEAAVPQILNVFGVDSVAKIEIASNNPQTYIVSDSSAGYLHFFYTTRTGVFSFQKHVSGSSIRAVVYFFWTPDIAVKQIGHELDSLGFTRSRHGDRVFYSRKDMVLWRDKFIPALITKSVLATRVSPRLVSNPVRWVMIPNPGTLDSKAIRPR